MNRSIGFRGLSAILFKEVRHLLRDPATLILAVLLPIIQLTIFGYAINLKVEHIASAYYDEDRGDGAIRVRNALISSRIFDLTYAAKSRDDLIASIVSGRVRVAFAIPPNFSANLTSHRDPQVQVLVDGSDSTVAQEAYAASTAVLSSIGTTATPVIDARARVLFNPAMRSANFLIPGLIGVIMQIITMFLTALSIAGERERGTLSQLLVTPVGAAGLMVGKILPYAAVGFVDFLIVLLAMRYIFDVPIAGSVSLLIAVSTVFLVCVLALGLLASTVARVQLQAILAVAALALPSILLSGFFFERSLMPLPMQWLGLLLPLTYYLEMVRGIVLRGASFGDMWQPALGLSILGIAIIAIASVRFARLRD